MKNTPLRVAIIGAGVTGITTGIVLTSVGAQVTIYADRFPAEDEKEATHSSLSNYAKGALIPKNISRADSLMRFSESISFFRKLYKAGWPIKHKQHLELVQKQACYPEFLSLMDYLEKPANAPEVVPFYSNSDEFNSWPYSYYLINPPEYLRFLQNQFYSLGGFIDHAYIERDQLHQLDADFVINCGGINGYKLDHNPALPRLISEYQIEIHTQKAYQLLTLTLSTLNPIIQQIRDFRKSLLSRSLVKL